MTRNDGVVLAEIGAPHGVRGEVRLKVFAEDPDGLRGRTLDLPDGRALRITHLRALKGDMYVARLDGITDRDAAEALRLRPLSAPRASLPPLEDEDDFYIADLIGLEVRGGDGHRVGTVQAVHDFGAGDLLDVRHDVPPDGEGGRDRLYAFTRLNVPEIDMDGGWLTLTPQDGAG